MKKPYKAHSTKNAFADIFWGYLGIFAIPILFWLFSVFVSVYIYGN